MKSTKKFLSLLLSVVMVFTVFNVAFVSLAPEVYAAPTAADYDALADAIRDLRTNEGNPVNAVLSVNGTEATYNDPTGDMIAVVNQYYSVFNGLRATGTINQNTGNRTATQVNTSIKAQMQSRFTSDELQSWAVVALLDSMIANANVASGENSNQNQIAIPTITVTVNDNTVLFAYANVDDLPASISQGVKYTVSHNRGSREDNSGCTPTTYYFAKISNVTGGAAGTIDPTPIRTLKGTIGTYADYYGSTFAELVEMDVDTVTAAASALRGDYSAVIENFGESVYVHFFGAYDTAGLLSNMDAAIAIQTWIALAQDIQTVVDVDETVYGLDNFDDLNTLISSYDQKLQSYGTAPADSRSFIESSGYINVAEVNDKLDELKLWYATLYLQDLKQRLDAHIDNVLTFDDDWVLETVNAELEINDAEATLAAMIADLSDEDYELVKAVFGENEEVDNLFDYVAQYRADDRAAIAVNVERLREVYGYKTTFANYQGIYDAAFASLDLETATDVQLLNTLKARDAWYTELQEFVDMLNETDPELAAKIFQDLAAVMEAKIAGVYVALNARVEAQIETAYAIYLTQRDEEGLLITEANLATYNQLMQSIGLINDDAYVFLKEETAHFDISAPTVEKYDELHDIIVALRNWDPSQHLSAYAYNAETLDPIVRYVNDGDVVRDLDYVLTDDNMQELIDLLTELLTGDKLAELGVELDLAGALDGLGEKVYTDKFVNNIMNALYPTLAELVRDKLAEMIPSNYMSMIGDLDNAFEKVNAGLSPKKVGKFITESKYSAIATALKGVTNSNTSGFMYGEADSGDNCWNSAEARNELYRVVLDENEEPVLDDDGNVTYELIFDWGIDAAEGIDAKREAFLDAMDASLRALQPVFMALLCNKAVPKTQVVSILGGLATLSLGVYANNGYNNTLVPLLEALGVDADAIYDAQQYRNIRDIVEFGLVKPVQNLLEQIKADPLNKILEILPTVAFAIQNNLFIDLLHNLKLDLDLSGGGCAGGIISGLLPAEGVGFDLGDPEILDLADTLGVETFYTDILSMDGVLSIVLALLNPAEEEEEAAEPVEGEEPVEPVEPAEPAPELRLPHLDGAKLAMLGTDVVWADSYRTESQIVYEGRQNIHANIIANKPQVMQFLLEYLLEAVEDEEFIPAILYMVNKDKAEDEQVALPETIEPILANVRENGTDVIAAIFELMHPVYRYTMPEGINWITEGTINATDYADYWTDVDAEGNETLWTQDKAVYMAQHLENFIDDVIVIFGEQLGGVETLGEAVDYLLANLFKAETLNDLAATLKETFGGIELPEAIADLGLIDQLGLDLTAWDDMTFSFADGDKAAFKAGLIELLDPLSPLLAFLLAEQDISISLLDLIDATAVGYRGYAYGIVPLLEALGATGIKSPDAYCADTANVVKNLIDPVFTVLDKLESDPLEFIETVIPSLLYFDKVGGVQVAVEHILTAVQVVLDIIRPIYDVDLYGLVADQFGFDLHFAETDPIDFLLVMIGDMIEESTGYELGIDFTAESLTNELNFTDPIKFTSANGDDAYTIRLSDQGKADLLTRVLDFGVNQVVLEYNYDKLVELVDEMIEDDDNRAMAKGLLKILKDADKDIADFHGVNDLALASVFWVFFGADTVTDATADYFYRYKDSNFYEILFITSDLAPGYAERLMFILTEVYKTEYPAFMKVLEERQNLIKPITEYTEEDTKEVAGIGARLIRFFAIIINFFRNLFKR